MASTTLGAVCVAALWGFCHAVPKELTRKVEITSSGVVEPTAEDTAKSPVRQAVRRFSDMPTSLMATDGFARTDVGKNGEGSSTAPTVVECGGLGSFQNAACHDESPVGKNLFLQVWTFIVYVLSSVFNSFDEQLRERPVAINFLMAMLISAAADAVSQREEVHLDVEPCDGFDLRRTCASVVTSGIYNGILLTSWLLAWERALPSNDAKSVFVKLACTQCLLQPILCVPVFFSFHGFLLNQSRKEIQYRLTKEYFPLLLRLWSLFTPTRLVMFLIVPLSYQVLWDITVTVAYQLVPIFVAMLKRPGTGLKPVVVDDERAAIEPKDTGKPVLPDIVPKCAGDRAHIQKQPYRPL